MKTIFFDIETTGLSATTDTILEVAAVVVDENFNVIDTYQSFINPGRRIPYLITQLTKITDDTVKNARTEYVVLNDFMNWVRRQNPQQVAGHNIKLFDLRWMIEKCNKHGIDNALTLPIVDTLDYAKQLHKDGVLLNYTARTAKGNMSFKLEHLVSYFGLPEQTHRAIDDVMQNIIVYKNLKKLEGTTDYGF